ncbi:MAG: hypothetical protein JWP47_1158 [Polaromonas sp.]|jgi:hypothetical protein|nr:hypothetical protein [Polaromonas sp.]
MNVFDLNPSRANFGQLAGLPVHDAGERVRRPEVIRRRMWPFSVKSSCATQNPGKVLSVADLRGNFESDCTPSNCSFVS